MPWSGGSYTKGNAATGGWQGDASVGIGIEADRHDTQDDDFTAGINNALTKDGQNTPTTNLPMGGYKHTGVGNATAADQYLSYGQLLDVTKAVATTGTAPDYEVTLTPAPSAYFAGMQFTIRPNQTLTSGSATINVNGLGAKFIRIRTDSGAGSRAIYGYEMLAGVAYTLTYDGSQFYLMNPQGAQILDVNKARTTTGTAPNYELTIYPDPNSYQEGLTVTFQIHANLTTATGATLNVNGMGAKPIYVKRITSTNRDVDAYELNSGGWYTACYDASISGFILLNPTFGYYPHAYTPSVSSDSGTAVLAGSNDNWWQWIGPNKIRMHWQAGINLSGSTSASIYLGLPFGYANHDAITFGIGYVSNLTGYSNYDCHVYLTSNAARFVKSDQTPFAIDSLFYLYGTLIYDAAP